MPKPNNNNTKSASPDDGKIKIKVEESSLAKFTKRSLPDEKQLEEFEDYVGEEVKDEEIDESLSEIYQDEKGRIVDVSKMEIKNGHGFIFWFIFMFFIFSGLAAVVYSAYSFFYLKPGSDATAFDFKIESKNQVVSGEEFFYDINFKNLSNISATAGKIEAVYPPGFIFIESNPVPSEKNNIWQLDTIGPQRTGKITVKGKILNQADTSNVIMANLSYMPENFSSHFSKEASFTTQIKDVGIDFEFDYVSSSLVGETNDVNIRYNARENNYINNFRLSVATKDNFEFLKDSAKTAASSSFNLIRPGVWQINEVAKDTKVLPIKFKFTKKNMDNDEIVIIAEKQEGENYYKFMEKKLPFEVMKSDLNLTLIINGSKDDQAVDFGQTMNYSVAYKNKGETEMKDVVIMAVIQSDFVSWSSLADENKGKVRGNTISWSKEEIPSLAAIARNQEGIIDFSIKLQELGTIDPGKEYQTKSYVQFSVGNKEEMEESADTKSNTIINQFKSDLKLKEQVRYFNDDNIPVGTGPNPPKAGEKTTYKVYWQLNNNLHELKDLKVVMKLPDYVSFDNKTQSSVGNVNYSSDTREVTWFIGRLPVTNYQSNAEFNIAVTPTAGDKNKIMVLIPGSKAEAVDTASNAALEFTSKAKTTKLEDDEIGGSDGIVQ